MGLTQPVWNYFQKQATRSQEESLDAVLSLCKAAGSRDTLLDCGCADGAFTSRVAQAISARRTVGLDIVPGNIAAARGRGVEGIVANLDRGLPMPECSFDLLVASHVIEHLGDTDLFLKECYRVLKPGGALVMATPNLAAFTNILLLLLGKQPTIAEVSDEALVNTWSPRGSSVERLGPAHRRLFTRGALRDLLKYYRFKPEQIVMTGFLPLPNLPGKVAATVLPRYAFNITVRARKLT